MRIAICEDDIKAQERLSGLVSDWADARNVSIDVLLYSSAEALVMALPDISFDLAFLDIQMQKMTGIELAEVIRKNDKNMLLVFITSYTQYVLKGYDVNALHYLIKPVSAAKLLPVLDKALLIWRSRHNAFILVPDESGHLKILFDDIYYISIESHTASIHADAKVYKLRKTAAELTQMLPNYFVRCHRSFIVNLFKADCVYKDTVLMSTGERVLVSRQNSKAVSEAFLRLNAGL